MFYSVPAIFPLSLRLRSCCIWNIPSAKQQWNIHWNSTVQKSFSNDLEVPFSKCSWRKPDLQHTAGQRLNRGTTFCFLKLPRALLGWIYLANLPPRAEARDKAICSEVQVWHTHTDTKSDTEREREWYDPLIKACKDLSLSDRKSSLIHMGRWGFRLKLLR